MTPALREVTIAAVLLMAFALVGAGLVAFIHDRTEARIEANRQATIRARLNELVPPSSYDNRIVTDTIQVTARETLGSEQPLTIYRARRNGEPVAAVITTVAPDGYSGPIRLLVAVRADGALLGVRVVSHRETPGLGDGIEADKSDWIEQFPGRRLGDPPADEWAVKKDGGRFDQLTGATITPRAVVRAVKNALIHFREHRERIFRATGSEETAST